MTMNRIYRAVSSQTRACVVVIDENGSSRGLPSGLRRAKRHRLACAITSALSMTLPFTGNTWATVITASSTATYTHTSGPLTINSGVTLGSTSNSTEIRVTSTDGGTLSNAGVILAGTTGVITGILNTGTLGAIINTGTIRANYALTNSGTLGTLNNSGLIMGGGPSAFTSGVALFNNGHLGTLTNTGTISGFHGLRNHGQITSFNNSGQIAVSQTAIYNVGTIAALTNSGTISALLGIYNSTGSMQALNNSGLISGSQYAIYNSASLPTITNSGTIAGAIVNSSSDNLTIVGGNGSVFGTLTGYNNAKGSILNNASNLVFGGGNILLNDDINVGSRTVSNVASTLQINNRLTISGNYNQSAGATLLFGVADGATASGSVSDTGYGRLYVTGNTTLAAGATIGLNTLNSYAFAPGQRYVVMVTSGTASYNASSLNYVIRGYSGTASGSSVADGSNTVLVVTLAATSAAGATGGSDTSTSIATATGTATPASTLPRNFATSRGAAATLAGLFNYSGVNTNLLNVFNSAAALGTSAGANVAGAQLSPTALNSGLVQAATGTSQAVSGIAYARMDGLRGSGGGTSGVATGEAGADVGLWGQVFDGQSRQSTREEIAGYRANYSGLLLGGDGQVSERVRAGGMFNYARTQLSSTDANTGSSASTNAYGLSLYGGYSADPWYVNALIGVTRQQYSTSRAINYTGFSGTADGSFRGLQYTGSLQAGYPLNVEHWLPGITVTPLLGLSYSSLRQGGYTESGGNGAALAINAASTHSLKSELALRMEGSVDSPYGKLTPLLQLGWRHEYQDSRLRTSAIFAADATGTSGFTTQSASPIRNTGVMTLGMTLAQSARMRIALRYSLEHAAGYTDQSANLQLRWQY